MPLLYIGQDMKCLAVVALFFLFATLVEEMILLLPLALIVMPVIEEKIMICSMTDNIVLVSVNSVSLILIRNHVWSWLLSTLFQQ